MASGWTLLFNDVDIDEQIELFIPVIVLIAMVHIVIATLTFVDVDSAHKHHDFAGVQGWVLAITKLFIFAYFIWCYVTTKVQLKKRS